jgi:hypothetical protein
VADGRRHRRRRQPGGGHLVQQRLEQVVVGAVDQRHLDIGTRQRTHRFQATEAAADDDHMGDRHGGSVAPPGCGRCKRL